MENRQDILAVVNRPSRYLGTEIHRVRKDPGSVRLRIALAFPDLYEIGMSHTGLKILYEIVNRRPDWSASKQRIPPFRPHPN